MESSQYSVSLLRKCDSPFSPIFGQLRSLAVVAQWELLGHDSPVRYWLTSESVILIICDCNQTVLINFEEDVWSAPLLERGNSFWIVQKTMHWLSPTSRDCHHHPSDLCGKLFIFNTEMKWESNKLWACANRGVIIGYTGWLINLISLSNWMFATTLCIWHAPHMVYLKVWNPFNILKRRKALGWSFMECKK